MITEETYDKDGRIINDIMCFICEIAFLAPKDSNMKNRATELVKRFNDLKPYDQN